MNKKIHILLGLSFILFSYAQADFAEKFISCNQSPQVIINILENIQENVSELSIIHELLEKHTDEPCAIDLEVERKEAQTKLNSAVKAFQQYIEFLKICEYFETTPVSPHTDSK